MNQLQMMEFIFLNMDSGADSVLVFMLIFLQEGEQHTKICLLIGKHSPNYFLWIYKFSILSFGKLRQG